MLTAEVPKSDGFPPQKQGHAMIQRNSSATPTLGKWLWRSRAALMSVALFSAFVNLLMLTGPLFSIQVYDRVLASRSRETLIALVLLAGFLFAILFLLDATRAWLMTRVAARVQSGLDGRLFDLVLSKPGPADIGPLRDLEAVQRALGGPVLLAVMDLPWTPIFLLAIFALHPLLGILALIGGAVLLGLSWVQGRLLSRCAADATSGANATDLFARQHAGADGSVRALGMGAGALARWDALRQRALRASVTLADGMALAGSAGRVLRLFLQSAMLALGAWLVMDGQISGGAMFAASILMGRALAPVEGLIAGWPAARRGLSGWRALSGLLKVASQVGTRLALPAPSHEVAVEGLTLTPPGAPRAAVQSVSFRLSAGQVLGIVGPSGSGKSTLIRAITGIWSAPDGGIRFDGAALDQYAPDVLGRAMGYLPQSVRLFEGTVAENIARLDQNPASEKVMAAARAAALHELIVRLPNGYDTALSAADTGLSGGQVQRIGLARALYGAPWLLVLDEPETGLDADGQAALIRAIRAHRARGGSVILSAHRMQLLRDCDLILALDDGRCRAFGPRDEVLAELATAGTALRTPSLRLTGDAA